MKKRIEGCPNCHQYTLQFKVDIPNWKGGTAVSGFKSPAWYCTKCTWYIVSVTTERAVDITKQYDLKHLTLQ